MNSIILFVCLPCIVTFVLCQNYGSMGFGGSFANGNYGNAGGFSQYGGYGKSSGAAKGQGQGLNVVYYPQITPYQSPYGEDQNGFDPILPFMGFLLLLFIFNISGING